MSTRQSLVTQQERQEKTAKILGMLQMAGYMRVRIQSICLLDKVMGGLAWCLQQCQMEVYLGGFEEDMNIGDKIRLSQTLVAVLHQVDCPVNIQPHQIQGLDLDVIIELFTWLLQHQMAFRNKVRLRNMLMVDTKRKRMMEHDSPPLESPPQHKRLFDTPQQGHSQFSCILTLFQHGDITLLDTYTRLAPLQATDTIHQSRSKTVLNKTYLVDQIVQNKEDILEMERQYQVEKERDEEMNILLDRDRVMHENSCLQARVEQVQRRLEHEESLGQERIQSLLQLQETLQQSQHRTHSVQQTLDSDKTLLLEYSRQIADSDQKILEMQTVILERETLKEEKKALKRQAKEELKQVELEKSRAAEEQERADELQCLIEKMSPEYLSRREVVSKGNQSINSLRRKIDNYPVLCEILQYQQRFMELFEGMNMEIENTRTKYLAQNQQQDMVEMLGNKKALLVDMNVSVAEAVEKKKVLETLSDTLDQMANQMDNTNQQILSKQLETLQSNSVLNQSHHQHLALQRHYYSLVKQLQTEIQRIESHNLQQQST